MPLLTAQESIGFQILMAKNNNQIFAMRMRGTWDLTGGVTVDVNCSELMDF
jgi:hypothetical protein